MIKENTDLKNSVENFQSFNKQPDSGNHISTRFLVNIVDWAFTIPVFNIIKLEDKIALLQNSWSELFIICVSQSNASIDLLGSEMINRNEFLNNNNNNCESEMNKKDEIFFNEKLQQFREAVEKINAFNLDNEEYSYLKAIILFSPGIN